MPPLSHPLRFLLVALAGWINQQQCNVIDYLREENRELREQLGGRRMRFTDDQRVRLAAKAKKLGRRMLTAECPVIRSSVRRREHASSCPGGNCHDRAPSGAIRRSASRLPPR